MKHFADLKHKEIATASFTMDGLIKFKARQSLPRINDLCKVIRLILEGHRLFTMGNDKYELRR